MRVFKITFTEPERKEYLDLLEQLKRNVETDLEWLWESDLTIKEREILKRALKRKYKILDNLESKIMTA